MAKTQMDWQQVVLNGGPPCFAMDDAGRAGWYCGRAERWEGHGVLHDYVSLDAALNAQFTAGEQAGLRDGIERAAKMAEQMFEYGTPNIAPHELPDRIRAILAEAGEK